MSLYANIKNSLKEGDELLTEVNSHPARRTVKVKGDGVVCKEHWFQWDFFFEVNHPVGEQVETIQ